MDTDESKGSNDDAKKGASDQKKSPIWVASLVTIITLARIGHGLFISISGPTLLFLADNVNSDVTQVSAMFSGRSLGILAGSIVFSAVINRFPKFKPLLSLGIGLIVNGLVMFATPFTTNLAVLVVITTLGGLMFGYLDSGMQALYLNLWGEEASRPYIQSFHFGFSVGAFLAPVIAKPFLEMASDESDSGTTCPNEVETTTAFTTAAYDNVTSGGNSDEFNPINWCFIITGAYVTVIALVMCVMALFKAEDKVKSHNVDTTEERPEDPISKVWPFFVAVCFYYFCCVSTETVYAGYIYSISFCSDLNFDVNDASLLNSLFWAGFGIGRGTAIIYSKFIRPSWIIIADLAGTTISLTIMSIWGENVPLVTWIVTFMHGLCVATLYSSGVSWTSQRTNMSGTYMFIFTIGNAAGGMTMMPAGGALFDNNPFDVIYLINGICAANIVFFIMMHVVAQRLNLRVKGETLSDTDSQLSQKEDINYEGGKINESFEPEPVTKF